MADNMEGGGQPLVKQTAAVKRRQRLARRRAQATTALARSRAAQEKRKARLIGSQISAAQGGATKPARPKPAAAKPVKKIDKSLSAKKVISELGPLITPGGAVKKTAGKGILRPWIKPMPKPKKAPVKTAPPKTAPPAKSSKPGRPAGTQKKPSGLSAKQTKRLNESLKSMGPSKKTWAEEIKDLQNLRTKAGTQRRTKFQIKSAKQAAERKAKIDRRATNLDQKSKDLGQKFSKTRVKISEKAKTAEAKTKTKTKTKTISEKAKTAEAKTKTKTKTQTAPDKRTQKSKEELLAKLKLQQKIKQAKARADQRQADAAAAKARRDQLNKKLAAEAQRKRNKAKAAVAAAAAAVAAVEDEIKKQKESGAGIDKTPAPDPKPKPAPGTESEFIDARSTTKLEDLTEDEDPAPAKEGAPGKDEDEDPAPAKEGDPDKDQDPAPTNTPVELVITEDEKEKEKEKEAEAEAEAEPEPILGGTTGGDFSRISPGGGGGGSTGGGGGGGGSRPGPTSGGSGRPGGRPGGGGGGGKPPKKSKVLKPPSEPTRTRVIRLKRPGFVPAEITWRQGIVERSKELPTGINRVGKDLSPRVTNNPKATPTQSVRVTRLKKRSKKYKVPQKVRLSRTALAKIYPDRIEFPAGEQRKRLEL